MTIEEKTTRLLSAIEGKKIAGKYIVDSCGRWIFIEEEKYKV